MTGGSLAEPRHRAGPLPSELCAPGWGRHEPSCQPLKPVLKLSIKTLTQPLCKYGAIIRCSEFEQEVNVVR